MARLSLILLFLFATVAHGKGKHQHGAHSHGSAELGIAFDGLGGTVELKIPNNDFLGFEHEAKSAEDKKKTEDAFKKLENSFSEIVVFDSSTQCEAKKQKIEIVRDGSHSESVASFLVTCQKTILGTKIAFNLQKFFPRLRNLNVQVLAGDLQKSLKVKKSGEVIELK